MFCYPSDSIVRNFPKYNIKTLFILNKFYIKNILIINRRNWNSRLITICEQKFFYKNYSPDVKSILVPIDRCVLHSLYYYLLNDY